MRGDRNVANEAIMENEYKKGIIESLLSNTNVNNLLPILHFRSGILDSEVEPLCVTIGIHVGS